ncbi:MAG: Protein disulfide oxidoreductase [uncultured Sulfurovum sp.]|uniref:Protein disulfide oxidoreductase n=1 Tax=uncultured Sulfurovum sp. TaxID=269237 RepID=A0A6S6SCT9_9BACT|nr:MAG: Protein disulfide oxidoreductase [uncultured Sulfurovum sp.]
MLRKPELSSTQLPTISETLIDGKVFTVSKNKPVVIHFWATWCPTCKLEAPNIETISKDYTVLSIAVNSGSDDDLQAYMQKEDLHFNVLNDKEGRWANQFNVEAFPTTFIYDGKGELRFTEVGYTSTVGLLARLKLL